MKLSTLISDMELVTVKGDLSAPVSSLCYNSQNCLSGSAFVAIRGLKSDGHRYINDAIARGARVIIHEDDYDPPPGVVSVRVGESRLSLGILAANFFRHPSLAIKLIGITGTNGKTTVTYLLESILKSGGLSAGVIGTINYRYADKYFSAPNTTPESYEFQRILREMADAAVSHVIAEVSSHALDLRRVDACDFDLAAFTNLSRDHLDYHQTMEDYYQAKKRLFSEVLPAGRKRATARSVINTDNPWGRRLLNEIGLPKTTYGLTDAADVHARKYSLTISGITASIISSRGVLEIKSALTGKYNLENILAAVTVALSLGIESRYIEEGIAALTSVPGRLERVSLPGEPSVFVDYAHTDDALFNVLTNLNQFKKRRIITLFGCGGNRDRGKRPKMGAVATSLSDLTIITSDNPRSEEPSRIIADIEAGIDRTLVRKITPETAHESGQAYLIISDRSRAIEWAINQAEPSDIVLIAGKGHEDYQLIGDDRLHFDDREAARACLDLRASRKKKHSASSRENSDLDDEPCLSAAEVLTATGGRLLQGSADGVFYGISTDSRSILRRNLFIPLTGERFDGHDFIDQAIARGAAGYLCRPGLVNPAAEITVIEVADTLVALGHIARYWRRRLPVKVVAITGSAGKTTTKDMTAAILELAGPTLKTQGNFNNLIGLPLTIFRLRNCHELAVLELGMNNRGEISRLTRIAEPQVGLITNVGPAHLENLKSLEMIREEKGDLFRNMSPEGIAVINLDDEAVRIVAQEWTGRRVTFSLTGEADVAARDIRPSGNHETEFLLKIGAESGLVRLATAGAHQVLNALAAAACAWACGISREMICRGLNGFTASTGRFCISQLGGGAFLIDDCYNANPSSLREALKTMAGLKGANRSIAVLGDMLELGDEAESYHERLGGFAVECGVDALLLTGNFRKAYAAGARRAGIPADRIIFFDQPAEVSEYLRGRLNPGDWILVKGSRRMKLESVVEEIKGVCC